MGTWWDDWAIWLQQRSGRKINARKTLGKKGLFDPMEAADIAVRFNVLGPQRLLATRLDLSRRLGGALAAAEVAALSFCEVSISPHVADGLTPINPVSLARLLLPHGAPTSSPPQMTEAAL